VVSLFANFRAEKLFKMRTLLLLLLVIITFGCKGKSEKEQEMDCKAAAMEAITSNPDRTMKLANS
jgi:hypothetical protein